MTCPLSKYLTESQLEYYNHWVRHMSYAAVSGKACLSFMVHAWCPAMLLNTGAVAIFKLRRQIDVDLISEITETFSKKDH